MYVIFEYAILILMPCFFWSLAYETKSGVWHIIPAYCYFCWFFSDIEEPFFWPILCCLATLAWWFFWWKFKKNVLGFKNQQQGIESVDAEPEVRNIEGLDGQGKKLGLVDIVKRFFVKRKRDDNPYDDE